LHFSESLQSELSNLHQSDQFFEFLNVTQQKIFMATMWGGWRFQWKVPVQTILTKWGFCFSFNLMPLDELLKMESKNRSRRE
jgi:hypothetical protein